MESAHPLRRLLGLAWPIVVSRSAQVVVGVSDAVMVASLGEAALAAVTAGALNTFALMILPMGVVFIVSSFASQLWGEGDAAGARRYGVYGLAVAAITQVVCVATLPAVGATLGLLDYAPDVRQHMTDYVAIRLLSGGAAIGIEALANYYGGIGNTRLPMLANVSAMVLNVLGNYLLIYGHAGFPALGVRGAAIASVAATVIAFAGLLFAFWRGVGVPGGVVRSRLVWSELLRMFRFGLPSGFNWFFEFFAFVFFVNVVVAGLGTTALATMMAVMQLNSVSFMPAFGLASAGAIMVGQAIGSGAKDEVPRLLKMTVAVTAGWQSLAGLIYLALPELVLLPFVSGDVQASGLLLVGAGMLRLSAAWQIFDAVATCVGEALRAAGDTAFTLWVRIAIAWAVFVPGVYLTVRHFGGGELAAVAWLVIYLGLLALVLTLRFARGAWRRIDLTGHAAVKAA